MTENIQGLVIGSSAEFSKQITPENIATFAEIIQFRNNLC